MRFITAAVVGGVVGLKETQNLGGRVDLRKVRGEQARDPEMGTLLTITHVGPNVTIVSLEGGTGRGTQRAHLTMSVASWEEGGRARK